jgi:hypothetical protein
MEKKGTTMKIKEKMSCSNVKRVPRPNVQRKAKTKIPPFATRPFGCMNISMAKLGTQVGNHLRG